MKTEFKCMVVLVVSVVVYGCGRSSADSAGQGADSVVVADSIAHIEAEAASKAAADAEEAKQASSPRTEQRPSVQPQSQPRETRSETVTMCGEQWPRDSDFLDILPAGWENRIGFYSLENYGEGCDDFRVVGTDNRGILISFVLENSGERRTVLYTCDGELY